MKTVAITGLPCSGKTAALKEARALGFPTVDCDAIVSGLYGKPAVKKKLLKEFGTSQKAPLSTMAFSSPQKRKRLESILHPLVWKAVKQKLSSFKKQKKALAFVEVPLLFEAGWQKRFDETVFVKAPRPQCISRLRKKGLSAKEAGQRLKAQWPQGKKIKSAHHIIDNGKTVAKTRLQVKALVGLLEN